MTLLHTLTEAAGQTLTPLQLALEDANEMTLLLGRLGWDVTVLDDDLETIKSLAAGLAAVADIPPLLEELLNEPADPGATINQLINKIDQVFSAIETLKNLDAEDVAGLPSPLDQSSSWEELALALPDYLFVTYLEDYQPLLHGLLLAGGVIEMVAVSGNENATRPIFNWNNLASLFTQPMPHLHQTYGWGGPTWNYEKFIESIAAFASQAGAKVTMGPVREQLQDLFFSGTAVPESLRELSLAFHHGWVLNTSEWLKAGLLVLPVPASPGGPITGLYVGNLAWGSSANLANVDTGDGWLLTTTGDFDGSAAAGVVIYPDKEPAFAGTAPDIHYELTLESPWTEPFVLLGGETGIRVLLHQLKLAAKLRGTTADPELVLELSLPGDGLAIVIDPADGDAFVQEALASLAIEVKASPTITWSSKTGLLLGGTAGLDISIPLNLHLPVITLYYLHLGVTSGGEPGAGEIAQIQADVAAAFDIAIVNLTLEGIGLQLNLDQANASTTGGTFGNLALALGFKPPNGLGLEVDAEGIVTGGGYLYHDPDKGEYEGIFDVEVLGLGLTAVGLLTTMMPNGSEGWSLFVSISADLPDVQLGFGFTLNKVGGLLGLNRVMDVPALQAGMSSGMLDAIMFPEDPVANAPAILSDLGTIFPPAQDQIVLGMMVQIGWGTPSLVTVDLGLIVQFPDPITVALIGQVEAILPDDILGLIILRFDVLGVVDFTNGLIAIDASLRDSFIVGISLTGDMSFRAELLDQPTILLSIGGFNPKFSPPSGFPSLRRLEASIAYGNVLEISLSCYLALTSNTVQFGARAAVWAKALGFTAEGIAEIDVLIQFNPFGFDAQVGFSAALYLGKTVLFAVWVSGQLTGPQPWYVNVTAGFRFLKKDREFQVEATIGKELPSERPETINVGSLLTDALNDPAAWREIEAAETWTAVTLADEAEGFHPAGQVQVTQNVVPFNLVIEQYGTAQIEGADEFSLLSVTFGSDTTTPGSDDWVEDWFAPAQFFAMPDSEKLTAPSFEALTAGVNVGEGRVSGGAIKSLGMTYEQIIWEPKTGERVDLEDKFLPSAVDIEAMLIYSAANTARATTKHLNAKTIASEFEKQKPAYVVTRRADATIDTAISPEAGLTYSETRNNLTATLATDPDLSKQRHIVLVEEAAA